MQIIQIMVDIKSKSRICLEQHNRLWFLLLKLRAAIGQERDPHHSASHARLLRWRKKFWHGSPAHLGARITSFLTHCSRTIFSLAAWLRGVHIIKQQHDTIHIISPLHLPSVWFVAKLATGRSTYITSHCIQRESRVVSRFCPLQTAILTIIWMFWYELRRQQYARLQYYALNIYYT